MGQIRIRLTPSTDTKVSYLRIVDGEKTNNAVQTHEGEKLSVIGGQCSKAFIEFSHGDSGRVEFDIDLFGNDSGGNANGSTSAVVGPYETCIIDTKIDNGVLDYEVETQ